ncbi:MAG: hypothetical protein R2720_12720 [Candidatus Nanopelagicales bacterium]
MVNSAVVVFSALASENAEEGGEAVHTSPFLYGGVALGVLLLLLFLVTRLNIDR